MYSEIGQLGSLLYNYRRPLHELQSLQDRRLRALIHHAYNNVPYYHELFKSAGLKPEDIQTAQDLARLPITSMRTLRSLPVESLTTSSIYIDSCIARATTGTTGEPFTVYFSPTEFRTRQLVDFRALLTIGIRPWDRIVMLGPLANRPRRWHEQLGFFRTDVISSAWALETQIRRLHEYQSTVLWAYAHILDGIVDELQGHLSSVVHPRILITSAFQLPARASRALRADLDSAMFNFYGSMEAGRIAHECLAHRGLHVNIDRLILECIQDQPGMRENQVGAAVITALDLYTMPFIRYRLGDLISFTGQPCTCGSGFPLIREPQGREYDLFMLPSGKRVQVLWLSLLLRATPAIEQSRVIQEQPDHVVVQLSFGTEPTPELLDNLKHQIAEGFQEPLQIDIHLYDFASERGHKFREIVSKVKPEAD